MPTFLLQILLQFAAIYSNYQQLVATKSNQSKSLVSIDISIKYNEIAYAEKYKVANNFVGGTKKFVIDLLKTKKCRELMLIN